jgi:hypothetical protein
MFTTLIPTENNLRTEHYTAAGEIEISARAEEKKMALLRADYRAMGRKAQRRSKSLLTLLTSFLSL